MQVTSHKSGKNPISAYVSQIIDWLLRHRTVNNIGQSSIESFYIFQKTRVPVFPPAASARIQRSHGEPSWGISAVRADRTNNHSLGAASFLASRFFRRRSFSDAACFSLRAFRFTFFFASISLRFELPAGFVFAMI